MMIPAPSFAGLQVPRRPGAVPVRGRPQHGGSCDHGCQMVRRPRTILLRPQEQGARRAAMELRRWLV